MSLIYLKNMSLIIEQAAFDNGLTESIQPQHQINNLYKGVSQVLNVLALKNWNLRMTTFSMSSKFGLDMGPLKG